jgi:hypothetical protein
VEGLSLTPLMWRFPISERPTLEQENIEGFEWLSIPSAYFYYFREKTLISLHMPIVP